MLEATKQVKRKLTKDTGKSKKSLNLLSEVKEVSEDKGEESLILK